MIFSLPSSSLTSLLRLTLLHIFFKTFYKNHINKFHYDNIKAKFERKYLPQLPNPRQLFLFFHIPCFSNLYNTYIFVYISAIIVYIYFLILLLKILIADTLLVLQSFIFIISMAT